MILGLYLFGPYGGIAGLWGIVVNDGFYDRNYIESIFNPSIAEVILSLNKIIAFVFFGSLVFCLVLPMFRVTKSTKYKATVVCFCLIVFIILFPKIFLIFK